MATIKSYTDLSQSKILAEILPIESADMFYCYGMDTRTKEWNHDETPTIEDEFYKRDIGDVPCWSLAALLEVLNFPSLTQNKEDEWEVCVFDHDNDDYIEKTASNPIDACYEMIIRLHELNLL